MRSSSISLLRLTRGRPTAALTSATQTLVRRVHNSINQPSSYQRTSAIHVRSFSTNAAAGGCGNGGCGCASNGGGCGSSNNTDNATSSGGCGSSGCACARASSEAAAESERRQSELAALQAEVNNCYQTGRYEDAMEVAKKANEIAIELFGDSHPVTASTWNNLALLHRVHRQDYAGAAKLYELALNAYKESVGEKHTSYLTCLNNLGLTYHSLGDLSRAHSVLTSVVDHYSNVDPASLKTSLPYAHAQMNLASVLRDRRGSEDEKMKAIQLFQAALKIVQRKYGQEHPLVGTIFNNMGLTHKMWGDYTKALPLYQQSLDIRSRNLPPQHPDLIITLNNLAECLRSMGKEEAAQAVQQKMMQIMEVDVSEETEATKAEGTKS